ncbi:MAG: Rieske (2Fe-2S) protein [Cellvibrio sp.]
MQNEWHFAVANSDLPTLGKSRGFSIEGNKFFVVNSQGTYKTYRNYCPHLGVTLEWREHEFLDPSGTLIECATHNALFTLDSGECVTGPCFGRSLIAIECQLQDQGLFVLLQ